MDMNEYQYKARKTALYPNAGNNVVYPTLGLAGEAGEVTDKVKKILRDHGGVFDDSAKESIMLELGDVLWYISQLSSELGFDLEFVAQKNIEKLTSRFKRGKISGDGDTR